MVVPWALAPIRRLVLVLLAVSLSPLSLGSSLTYTVWRLVGVQPLHSLPVIQADNEKGGAESTETLAGSEG